MPDNDDDIMSHIIYEHNIGCRIIELNGDGRLMKNGAQLYLEEMKRLKGDIMIILDTGMDEQESVQFQKQIGYNDSTTSTQAVPAIKNRHKNQVLPKGGILMIVTNKWSNSIGRIHTDASDTGLLAKMKIRCTDHTITLIIGYWPIPRTPLVTADIESMAAYRRLESWLHRNHVKKSPQQWMIDVTSTWVTVAQEASEIPIVMGDFNLVYLRAGTCQRMVNCLTSLKIGA